MSASTGHVMTLANSIIGVSVLAMPFCFKQCGIILSVLMLLISSVITRLCCHFLVKSATIARRRTYEFLAFHTFGPTGKLAVELSIIGFLLGTCIAFFVVMGDLGPDILIKAFGFQQTEHLRSSVLVALAVFVVLPLGLLRNVDSLTSVCTASILFYLCLVLKVVNEATPHLLAADWLDHVNLWRPAGVLQCMPIFSMALACQTQVFEIYQALPDANVSRMNEVVRAAVNICTGVYICVGFFGYVAFCTQNFTGNVLMSFSPSLATDVMKLGFVLSVAVSFPLVIFPCRASLYSLLFRRVSASWHPEVSGGPVHIPEGRFKCLTVVLVGVSLLVGLLLPNIELVLGLVGSTIGTIICLLLPALVFTRLASKYSSERLIAQCIFFIAAAILVLSTYANLYAADQATSAPSPLDAMQADLKPFDFHRAPPLDLKKLEPEVIMGKGVIGSSAEKLIQKDDDVKKKEKLKPKKNVIVEKPKKQVVKDIPLPELSEGKKEPELPKFDPPKVDPPKVEAPVVLQLPIVEAPAKPQEQVAQDAIIKDEEERVVEEGKPPAAKVVNENKQAPEEHEQHEQLLAKLAEHEETQQKLLQEQKKILEELKEQRKENVEAEKKEETKVEQPSGKIKPMPLAMLEPVAAKLVPDKNVVPEPAAVVPLITESPVHQENQMIPVASDKQSENAVNEQPAREQKLREIASGLEKLTKELHNLDKEPVAEPAKKSNIKAQPLGALLEMNKQKLKKAAAPVNLYNDVVPKLDPVVSNAKPEQSVKQIREKREAESPNTSCTKDDLNSENKVNKILDKHLTITDLKPELPVQNKNLSKILLDKIVNSSQFKSVSEHVEKEQNIPEQSVKTSHHLTVPEIKLDTQDSQILEKDESLLGKPMSRDLRSVNQEEE